MEFEINGDKFSMVEVFSVVSSRRFIVGTFVEEDSLGIHIKYALCMDEMRDQGGAINYMSIPDPMLFSESPTRILHSQMLASKILDSKIDADFISKHKDSVTKYRAVTSGLLMPGKNLSPVMG